MVYTKLSPWRLAVKPGSLPKVIVPTVVGGCMGIGAVGAIPPLALFIFALIIALCAQWSIVLLNDYADLEADTAHRQYFPELIDTRVLVEGLLTPSQVLGAGLLAALGALATGTVLVLLYERLFALYLVAIGLVVLWVYSFAPLRLNYRGGGEVLEVIGVGVVLPVTGYYICAGVLPLSDGHLLVPLVLYALVGALASGLKHEPADRANGKYTFCVFFGARMTRKWIWVAQMAARFWCGIFFLTGEYGHFALVLGALLPAAPMFVTRRFDKEADYRNLAVLKRYKQSLTQAGYLNSVALALDFVF